MKSTAQDSALRLHTSLSGSVWCGQNGVRAVDTDYPVSVFVKRTLFTKANVVRVLGVVENADLLLALCQHAQTTDLPKIQIGCPPLNYDSIRTSPQCVLQHMWQPPAASLASVWRDVTPADLSTYTIMAELRKRKDGTGLSPEILSAAMSHPAWPAVSFPLMSSHLHACRLICDIVDPRFYRRSVDRPDRPGRLFEKLGISRHQFAAYCTFPPLVMPRNSRYGRQLENVVHAWAGDGNTAADAVQRFNDDPRNFLWRIFSLHADMVDGLTHASRIFVRFVQLVWLQGLAGSSREVFVPEFMFKFPAEAAAFKEHLAHCRKRV